jgi:serine/threonine protein kinase
MHTHALPSPLPSLPCRYPFQVFKSQPARLTKASDVYSFGVVMYEVLTWKLPFDEERPMQVGVGSGGWGIGGGDRERVVRGGSGRVLIV